jgi:hypothetical protein
MSIVVVSIKDATVTPRNVGDFKFEEQSAIMEAGAVDRFEITVQVPRGKAPYSVGRYTLDGSSFERDKYGRIQLRRDIRLVPLAEAGKLS